MTRYMAVLLLALTIPVVSASEKRFWSMGFQGEGPAQQFDFGTVVADGDSLTAQGVCQNLSESGPLLIRGVKKADGTFWPDATLQLGDSVDGPWRTFSHSAAQGKKHILRLRPGGHTFNIHFDLSPYDTLLGKHLWARIVLSSGDSALIPLGTLPP